MTTVEASHLAACRDRWEGSRFFRPGLVAIPAVMEHTVLFDAGVVQLGVESRQLTADIVGSHFDKLNEPTPAFDEDSGPSLHVFGTEDHHEYLRFDCFDQNPHYHYLVPGLAGVVAVLYDRIANGPMGPWALDAVRTRLPDLLTAAGAPHLAQAIDSVLIDSAIGRIQQAGLL